MAFLGLPRPPRFLWPMVWFLIGFVALILLLIRYFLLPAADAARDADVLGRRQLSAVSMLLLAVVLITLLVGLMLVFRIRRYLAPGTGESRQRTETRYVDAWTESGKRLQTPPRDEQ